MNKRNLGILLVVFNFLGYALTITVNALANALPINNKTTGELSDSYPNLFVPAGITFSIWGVIYLLLTFFVIYQIVLLIKNKVDENSFVMKTGLLFFISSIANAGWIFAWHYQILPLSVLIMVILLITLISIYSQLNIGKDKKDRNENKLVHITFSVYLGWISIATIANFTAYIVDSGWDRFGMSEEFWTVIMLMIGIAITMFMIIQRKDIYFSLVVIWAFAGILIKRISTEGFEYYSILLTAGFGIVIIVVTCIIQLFRKRIY